jgi:hypothetical protein
VAERGSFSDYIDKQLQESISYLKNIKTQAQFIKMVNDFSKKRKEQEKNKKNKKIEEIFKNK